jgi:predicted adenine nucleotide alpha hydrolase (AANH) superfamily ATPase
MKDKLVLHICCAPDEAWGITVLKEQYDLSCFFCNPNISPVDEYNLRLEEASRVAREFDIPFDADIYDPQSWESAIEPFSATSEGGERCRACFLLRLRRTALFCTQKGITSFATVMSVSPHKNIKMLNETGNLAAKEYSLHFFETNLKKNDGFKKSTKLSESMGIYRQNYCGCRLSKREREVRERMKEELFGQNTNSIGLL